MLISFFNCNWENHFFIILQPPPAHLSDTSAVQKPCCFVLGNCASENIERFFFTLQSSINMGRREGLQEAMPAHGSISPMTPNKAGLWFLTPFMIHFLFLIIFSNSVVTEIYSWVDLLTFDLLMLSTGKPRPHPTNMLFLALLLGQWGDGKKLQCCFEDHLSSVTRHLTALACPSSLVVERLIQAWSGLLLQ